MPKSVWEKNNSKQPIKAMNTPTQCLDVGFEWKRTAPEMMAKIGVSEFSVPANELLIPISAKQNKYAGIKLPKAPDKKTTGHFLTGISLIPLAKIGKSTIPDDTILKDATW